MSLASHIRICKKCGIHFIYSKKSKLPADIQYCHECRGDKYSGTAVLLARVIEKMLREDDKSPILGACVPK